MSGTIPVRNLRLGASFWLIHSSAFAGPNTGANSFAVGWGYALSKRTEVYTLYTAIDNHSAAGYDFGSNAIGVKAGGAAFVGASPKGGLLGIKHVF